MFTEGFNYICEQLNNNGFKAYAVGGAVRDYLLGKECGDIDIATSATPQEIISVFAKEKKVLTGLKHGTVGIVVKKVLYEVTTFRQDGNYLDNRHPDSVNFVRDLSLDLARRDFTINAICYNEQEGIVDLYNGQQDLQNKVIRCVGNADLRFKEDALRILRALRFSSQLGFSIEENTSRAIFNNAHLLSNISAERIYTELKKLLCGKNVARVLLDYKEVIAVIIPELKPTFGFSQRSVYHSYDVYEHIVRSIESAEQDEFLRLVLLLHDIGKPQCFVLDSKGRGHCPKHPTVSAEMATNVFKRLKVDKNTFKYGIRLIELHDRIIEENKIAVKEFLRAYGEKTFLNLLKVKNADAIAHAINASNSRRRYVKSLRNIYREIKRNNECFNLKNLAVNGKDLKKLGYSGKEVGEILSRLLTAVIQGEPNDKENLLRII